MLSEYLYLIAPFLGWFSAQGIKFLLSLRRDGVQWSDAFASGGMPSSHTAMTATLAILVGLKQGFETPLFAATLLFTMIVMYDAMGVRRSTGENTKAIQFLARHTKTSLKEPVHLAKGHRPTEVAGGFLVGVVAALFLANF
jgi:uncharacterized protein